MVDGEVPHHIVTEGKKVFKKKQYLVGEEEVRAWEQVEDWENPFGDDQVSSRKPRKSKKKRSKRKSRRNLTDEELGEINSQADSMLDDLLGEEDDGVQTFPTVDEEGGEDDSVAAVRHESVNNDKGQNPFDDPEEGDGEEYDRQGYETLMKAQPKKATDSSTKESSNPFEDSDGEDAYLEEGPPKTHKQAGVNPFEDDSEADDEASEAPADDDSSLEPPEEYEENNNPFEDEYVADSEDLENEDLTKQEPVSPRKEELTDRTASESFDSEEQKRAKSNTKHNPAEATRHDSCASSEEEEDLVESSKRLLRMADKRFQYQQHNDEVKQLKSHIETMKIQAEAMSMQLRRAVETKCDLVLSQTEMERCHEQDLIAADDELKDMKIFIQELMEKQAMSELNFMNEISSLSNKINVIGETHQQRQEEKDSQIAQLETKIKSMRTESVRGNSSRSAFKNRFMEGSIVSDISTGSAPDVPKAQLPIVQCE